MSVVSIISRGIALAFICGLLIKVSKYRFKETLI
jgi:hypothetical protein